MFKLNTVPIEHTDPCDLLIYKKIAKSSLRKPIIIKNAISSWAAAKKWDWDYLKKNIGNVYVPLRSKLATSRPNTFDGDYKKSLKPTWMLFDKYIEDLRFEQNLLFYLAGVSIPDYFPALEKDLEKIPYLSSKKTYKQQLWVGRKGTVAPLHYDIWDNFLCQIQGDKKVVLFDVKETKKLNAYSPFSKAPHLSKTQISEDLYTENELISNASAYEGKLDPGDILFMPAGWWHQVWTVNDSISVNYWWFNKKYVWSYSYLRSLPFILKHYRQHQQAQGRSKKD